MKLKSIFLSIVSLMVASASAQTTFDDDVIVLDLSKSTTPLTFESENGMWAGTYDDEETEIESQVFSIVHGCYAEWKTWWGFTASNSTNNLYQSNTLTYQFSNMAKGGILLNEDGSIKTNEFGAPVSGKEMPYLVGYPKAEITFNTGKSYEVIGAYVNLNSYTFYSVLYGDSFSRAFTEGDNLKLTVHGVDAEENEKTVEVSLASFSNGTLTASTGWKYIDLSSLGEVEEIYFTMSSTDTGEWGMNTPGYFCLDKLAVKETSGSSSVSTDSLNSQRIYYNRITKTINLEKIDFMAIYDAAGKIILTSTDKNTISVEDLPAGIYIAKAGNNRLKFAR